MSRPVAEVGSTASSYEILAKLATGGMAEIFLARGASAAGVERYVVLKRVLPEKASDAEFLRMFLDEARLAAQLQHPHIAQVYDIGKLGESYFFTMEYVHGETVRGLLQRAHALQQPIPIATVLTIAAGAAAGLHHAHERIGTDGRPLGIVHRDMSPSNLMVSYEGAVKVVDFGVAKAAHRSHETRSGTVKGKISYLSPEQCKGGEVDRRSDLFSLGILIWEMLTTDRLFKRSSDFENMNAIVGEPSPPPSSLRPEVPPELDAIVGKLLEKLPENRYQTADAVHEALEAVAVRTGSALSSAALGRLMRELFGLRPEPWLEMKTREAHPEVVTVTREPFLGNSSIPIRDGFEADRQPVPEAGFSRLAGADPNAHRSSHVPPEAVQTLAMGVVDAQQLLGPPSMGMASVQGVAEAVVQGAVPRGPSSEQLAQTLPFYRGSAPGSQPAPIHPSPLHGVAVTPMHTPSRGAPLPLSHGAKWNEPAHAGAWGLDVSRSRVPQTSGPAKRVPRIVLILGPALVLAAIIGVVVGAGGKRDKVVASPDLDTPAAPAVVATVPIDAAGVVPVVAKPPDPVTSTAVLPPASVDAAVSAEPEPEPEPEHHTDEAHDVKPPVHRPKPPSESDRVKKRPAVSLAPALDDLLARNKPAEAVTLCAGSASTLDRNPVTCVMAACRAHEAGRAKKWLQIVPAGKRATLAVMCKSAGTTLDTPTPRSPHPTTEDECARDPMACMH